MAKSHVLRQLALVAVGLVAVLVVAGQLARADRAPALRNDSRPTWSYDARYLAFTIGNSTTAIAPAAHGPEQPLRPGQTRGWRPGGDEFLNQVGWATDIVSADGRIVANIPGTFATWSPDGGRIAYIRDGNLYTAAGTGTGEQKLSGPFSLPTWEVEGPVWSPNGAQIVLATTAGLRVVDTDGSASKLIYTGANQSANPSWSPRGTIAFETNAGQHWSIWFANPDGSNAHVVLTGDANYRFPQFSPVDDRLAYISDTLHIRGGATPFQYALYVDELDGSKPHRVLDDVRPDEPAAWSPTGAQLAAAAGEECLRWGIYVASAERVALPHGNRRTNICRFDGTARADTLRGSPYHDVMNGNGGNDVIYGNGGPDKISGENGDDTIYGGGGNDFILAGPGNDRIYGGTGNDVIIGGNGRDRIDCGAGNDTVEGAGPLDVIARNCEHVRR